ncbi:putative subunit 14 of mediator of RNA polymerase II transcription complex [Chloropicon primus]|uniref:Mediator of RNA polymerase II transcription subunit 14 n=1 Tax=Chloropicon primus TaxID=1764295 RepID=A0A5B8MK56_9CHLO|nr:putative subunit 14 of mediator of RNA polymerase II transcription complex [Chloropicon primus]UPR00039.1 putative subunit 14 of mediator of RNA polymerase II transcription complex [Chloropicon primus]|mmetsp:Transcript_8002/g.22883  ORF Transcript_8002/g.22883 Transcript_8002/m.22883 type:complete len:632 (-) Transcript_8002:824-2719(-)|eukprot:QDZ20827.1 putative subunit 14 of mediator of RNA polymerase II transcription complex [Chloropicon primus]
MVKLKIKVPLSGRESIGSGKGSQGSSAALPKIKIKGATLRGDKEGDAATAYRKTEEGGGKEGTKSLDGRGQLVSSVPSVSNLSDLTMTQTQQKGSLKTGDFPDHARVSDFRLASFEQIASNLVEQAYRSLQEVCINTSGGDVSDEDRKRKLLRYVNETRQRLIRLLVLASWHKAEAKKVTVLEQCMVLLQGCENFNLGLRTVSDNLALLHDELRNLFQPRYDVSTALDLICNEELPLMPSCLEDMKSPRNPVGGVSASGAAALKRLSTMTYTKLLGLRDGLVNDFGVELEVRSGRAHIVSPGLFEVVAALNPMAMDLTKTEDAKGDSGSGSEWDILSVKLLMGSCENCEILSEDQVKRMTFQLQQLLLADSDKETKGMLGLVKNLKELCSKLVIYTCSLQLNNLLSENQKGKLRKLVQKEDSSQTGLLRCLYWVESKKNARTFVELGLDESGRYSCKNVCHSESCEIEEHFDIDTKEISMEKIIWQGASLACEAIIARLCEKLTTSSRMKAMGSLSVATDKSKAGRATGLTIYCEGTSVLGAKVDVCTGVMLLFQSNSDWTNPELLNRFRHKHAEALATAADVLGSEQRLAQLAESFVGLLGRLREGALATTTSSASLEIKSRKRKLEQAA